MGAWGVTATEDDDCLDLLDIVKRNYLIPKNFQYFNVKEIIELLKQSIIDEIIKTNKGCSKEEINFYIKANFQNNYNYVILLVSDCLMNYFLDHKLIIDIFDGNYINCHEKEITKFVFSNDDLEYILMCLKDILSPNNNMYKLWGETNFFNEWLEYIKKMYKIIESQIDK